MLDHSHDEVEVLLSPLVSYIMYQYLTLDIYPRALSRKDPLDSLEHVEDLVGGHTPVVVIVAQFEHHLQFLLVYYSGK